MCLCFGFRLCWVLWSSRTKHFENQSTVTTDICIHRLHCCFHCQILKTQSKEFLHEYQYLHSFITYLAPLWRRILRHQLWKVRRRYTSYTIYLFSIFCISNHLHCRQMTTKFQWLVFFFFKIQANPKSKPKEIGNFIKINFICFFIRLFCSFKLRLHVTATFAFSGMATSCSVRT